MNYNKLLWIVPLFFLLAPSVLGVTIFEDDFNRADNAVVGNGWGESENTGVTAEIISNVMKLTDASASFNVIANQSTFSYVTPDIYTIEITQKQTNNNEGSSFGVKSGSTNHIDFRFDSSGQMTCCNNNDNNLRAYSADTYYDLKFIVNKTGGDVTVFVDDVDEGTYSLQNTGTTDHDTIQFSTYGGGLNDGLFVDDIIIYNMSVAPFAHVNILDLYDSTNIIGATVCLTTDHICNVTAADGVAYFHNYTGQGFNVTHPSYFDGSGTANENETTEKTLYGAFINLTVQDLINDSVLSFDVWSGENHNSTTNGNTKILLKPNASNSIIINNSGYLTYYDDIVVSNKDLGVYNVTGLYQTILSVNATLGNNNILVNNWTGNITGTVNTLGTTINGTYYYNLLFGEYNIAVTPLNYSLSSLSFNISSGNTTPYISIPLYSLNSLYFNFLDEVTINTITEEINIEIISSLSSNNYTTTNGTLQLELLTPNDYTIRYSSDTYNERDYYITLVENNYYDLTLYGINGTYSYPMIVTVVDTLGNPIEGAQVQLRRYFVGSNTYEIVEMAYSSYNGEAFFNVQGYDGHYKLAVTYNGRTLLTNSPENFVPINSIVERTITFNTGADYYSSYQILGSVARTLSYNNDTGTFSFAWNDPSGIVNAGCIYADYPNGTKWSRLSNCQNSSSGNVILTLNDAVNTTYRYNAILFTSTNYSEYNVFSGYKDAAGLTTIGGTVGAFFGVMLLGALGVGGAFLGATGALIGIFIGVIFVSVLKLLPFGWAFITGLAALISGMAIYLMRK